MADPTFTNLSFDIAGPPGLAVGWTLRLQSSAEEIAGYAPAPERPQEDFERGWSNNESFLFAFQPAGLEPALFGAALLSIEGFEQGWSQNESFLTELASIEAATYSPGAKSVEDFEAQWAGNESFITAFAPANLALGPSDGFESGWHSNELFLFAFGNADLALGPSETFESGWTTHMATV